MKHFAIHSAAKRRNALGIFGACLCIALLVASGASPANAAVNNPPTLDPINSQTVLEDSAATLVSLTGISDGEIGGGQILTVSASSSDPSILPDPAVTYTSPNATGSLSFTPAPDKFGEVDVTVTVKDDGGTVGGGVDTFSRIFHVTITPVNDPPSFVKGSDPVVLEDCGPQTILNWATQISAGPGETAQTLQFILSPSRTDLFSAPPAIDPATGTLTFTPAPNANGSTVVTVILKDDGGTTNGGSDTFTTTFTITVTPVNDPPVISSFPKTGTRGMPLAFTAQDFLNVYTDIEANPLVTVKIVSLPAVGTLTLNKVALSTNAEIPVGQLGNLVFVPPSSWYGSTSFTWTASDGLDYSPIPAAVNITYPYSPVYIYLPSISKPGLPWTTALKENFEGTFPGKWVLSSGYYDGVYWYDVTDQVSWGKRNCHVASGSYAGWAVGGGSVGSKVSCSGSYPDNTETWMVYGPIDLSQVKDGLMSMKIWSDTEYQYDEMGWGISLDNDMFYGHYYTGYSGGWIPDAIDLKNVYQLGNVTGQSRVWIGIWFASDIADVYYEEGVAVDDFVLSTCPAVNGCTDTAVVSEINPVTSSSFHTGSAVESRRKNVSRFGTFPLSGIFDGSWSSWILKGVRPNIIQ